jgi:hypothetical protein
VPSLAGRAASAVGHEIELVAISQPLWAANDLPNPPLDLGTVERHLGDLRVPADATDVLRVLLTASPEEVLRQQLDLIDIIGPHLVVSRTDELD